MATTLVNRMDERLDVMFDGIPYTFEPGQEMTLPDHVAKHLRKRSLIKDNPITGEGTFALARKGIDSLDTVSKDGELLDRTDMDDDARAVKVYPLRNPIGRDGGPVGSALDDFQFAQEKSHAASRKAERGPVA